MSESIRLFFLTDENKIATMRISRANPSVTATQIRNAMNDMINSSAFNTNGRGNIVAISNADLVVTNVIHFDVS